MVDDSVLAEKDTLLEKLKNMKTEIKKRIKGYEEEIDLSLIAVAAFGHVLYTGFPGLAKTLLAKTVAEVSGCGFNRIQLTPDLTPSDIRGTEIWRPNNQSFELYPGPIFTNIVLADEINRTPPKTQSAFLDAMQEKVVTIGNRTLSLPNPFMVFATRNPIEQEGIYPLPEAQLKSYSPIQQKRMKLKSQNRATTTLSPLIRYGIRKGLWHWENLCRKMLRLTKTYART